MGMSFLVVVVVLTPSTTTTPDIRSGMIHDRSVSMISTRRAGFQGIPSTGNWNWFGFATGRGVIILGLDRDTSLVRTLAIHILTIVSLLFRPSILGSVSGRITHIRSDAQRRNGFTGCIIGKVAGIGRHTRSLPVFVVIVGFQTGQDARR